MTVDVYVPRPQTLTLIDRGSGVVGSPDAGSDGGRLRVDYEGNRLGSVNMVTFADRVHIAAGRHVDRYPTVARAMLDRGTLVRVGSYDPETGEVDLAGSELPAEETLDLVADWLGVEPVDLPDQLRTAGSARHQMRRDILAAYQSGNPAQRFAAEQMAARFGLAL